MLRRFLIFNFALRDHGFRRPFSGVGIKISQKCLSDRWLVNMNKFWDDSIIIESRMSIFLRLIWLINSLNKDVRSYNFHHLWSIIRNNTTRQSVKNVCSLLSYEFQFIRSLKRYSIFVGRKDTPNLTKHFCDTKNIGD